MQMNIKENVYVIIFIAELQKLIEVDAVPTASSRDVINEEDVFEILKFAVNEKMKFGQ